MKIGLRQLSSYLEPSDLSLHEAQDVLTRAGFPVENVQELPGGDACLEVEVTSNRGDCLSYVGLAREVVAMSGGSRRLKLPTARAPKLGSAIAGALTLENQVPQLCPLFLARVIRGVKVGPSPAWLVRALESVGQRSISNVVDATNYVALELGNPSHVFDLEKLEGRTLIVRAAREGEELVTLDGQKRSLKPGDVVVADKARAQSLAGVMGGQATQVTNATRDVVLELATWEPTAVRRTARRLGLATSASARFERLVDPRTLEEASRRVAGLIVELAGGTLCEGALAAGAPPAPPSVVRLRAQRCREVLGLDMTAQEIRTLLERLQISVRLEGSGVLLCEIPPFRVDLSREVDLIEEVARVKGLEAIEIPETIRIKVSAPQMRVRALGELGHVLAGLGFYEAVTFTFSPPARAAWFTPAGVELVEVDRQRRPADPALRPSLLTGLLESRRVNQDAQASVPGGVRLFETAAVFGQQGGRASERQSLALLMDVSVRGKSPSPSELQQGVRALRGAIETLTRELAGEAALTLTPAAPPVKGFGEDGFALVTLDGKEIGRGGLIAGACAQAFGLEGTFAAAELDLNALLERYPPRGTLRPLPLFPSIRRDLSPIVDQGVRWEQLRGVLEKTRREQNLARLEEIEFVGTYAGEPIPRGRKSVTLRLHFRDPSRTLRHEEVDPEVAALSDALTGMLGAAFRGA